MDLSYIQKEHDTPFLVVHRSDLQKSIIDRCHDYPDTIKFKLDHTVVQVQYGEATGDRTRFLIRRAASNDTGGHGIENGNSKDAEKEEVWFEADVVIGADGIRSVARRDMLKLHGEDDHGECKKILP